MKQFLSKKLYLYNDSNFYTRSIIFTLLSLIAAIVNYSTYPIVARLLEVPQFGEFTILISIITQVGGMLLALNIVSVHLVAKRGEKQAKKYLESIQKLVLLVFTMMILISFLVSPIAGHLLNINNGFYFILAGFILLLSIPSAIWSGYFQGAGKLQRVGIYNLASATMKFIAIISGVLIASLTGSLVGLFIGTFMGLVIFWLLPGEKPPLSRSLRLTVKDFSHVKPFYGLIARALLIVALMSLVQILDLLIIKSKFSPDIAGQYAGITTLTKIIFYVGFIIIWTLLPEIAKSVPPHRKKLINKSYLIFAGISIIGIVFTLFIGNFTITTLMGDSFNVNMPLMVWSAIYQSGVLLLTFQAYSLIAINSKLVSIILPLFITLLVVATHLSPISELEIIKNYTIITLIFSIILGINLIYVAKKYEKVN